MFSEQIIIDHLQVELPTYEIDYAEQSTWANQTVPLAWPRVYVGHTKLVPRNQTEDDLIADGYMELDRPLILHTSLIIVCNRVDLTNVRNAVVAAYQSFSPIPDQGDYSRMIFIEAGLIQAESGLAWWQEVVGTCIPRIV